MLESLDIMQFAAMATVVVGVVELINRLRAKDLWAAATIVSSALVGAIFGAIGYYDSIGVVEGVAVGLGGSGLITIVGARKSTPAENTNIVSK